MTVTHLRRHLRHRIIITRINVNGTAVVRNFNANQLNTNRLTGMIGHLAMTAPLRNNGALLRRNSNTVARQCE